MDTAECLPVFLSDADEALTGEVHIVPHCADAALDRPLLGLCVVSCACPFDPTGPLLHADIRLCCDKSRARVIGEVVRREIHRLIALLRRSGCRADRPCGKQCKHAPIEFLLRHFAPPFSMCAFPITLTC